MGKLYNFVMVRCTTLLEKFFRHPVDLEFHLLNGENGGLPIEPTAGFWQSHSTRADPKSHDDSNATALRAISGWIDDAVDIPSSQAGHQPSGADARLECQSAQQSGDRHDTAHHGWPGSLLAGSPPIRPRAEFPAGGAAVPWRGFGVSRLASNGFTADRTPMHQGYPPRTPMRAPRRDSRSSRRSGGRRRDAETPTPSRQSCKTAVHRRNCNCKSQALVGPAICDHDRFNGAMRMFSAIVRPISSSPVANNIDACVDAWSTELV